MAASYNFRSAFNGFHREDVVHYIEYINSKHTSQTNQLKSDLAAAQQENEKLRSKPERAPELEAQNAELSAKLAKLEAELQTAEAAWAELEKELAQVKQERDAALSAQAAAQRRSDEELEAYRRAERMERQAKERADAMFQRANGVIADATFKVDEASAKINGIADQVLAQLSTLQDAVAGSKQALRDASTTLYTIHPEE